MAENIPLEIATQSLILSALSMTFPVASISSRRLSCALSTRWTFSSSSSSSPDLFSSSESESESESLSSLLSLLSEPVMRNLLIPMAFPGTACFGAWPSSPDDMDSSDSEDEESESESLAVLKNRDMIERRVPRRGNIHD